MLAGFPSIRALLVRFLDLFSGRMMHIQSSAERRAFTGTETFPETLSHAKSIAKLPHVSHGANLRGASKCDRGQPAN